MQRDPIGFMRVFLAALMLCSVSSLIPADDHERVTSPNRLSSASAEVSTRVRVMQGGKWSGLDELRRAAQQLIDKNTTNVPWGDLQEVGVWVDSEDRTDFVTFHFSFGLGKQSFLVSFGTDGRISQLYNGIAVDSVAKPAYEDFEPGREKVKIRSR